MIHHLSSIRILSFSLYVKLSKYSITSACSWQSELEFCELKVCYIWSLSIITEINFSDFSPYETQYITHFVIFQWMDIVISICLFWWKTCKEDGNFFSLILNLPIEIDLVFPVMKVSFVLSFLLMNRKC